MLLFALASSSPAKASKPHFKVRRRTTVKDVGVWVPGSSASSPLYVGNKLFFVFLSLGVSCYLPSLLLPAPDILMAPKALCLLVLVLRYYIMHNPPPVWGQNLPEIGFPLLWTAGNTVLSLGRVRTWMDVSEKVWVSLMETLQPADRKGCNICRMKFSPLWFTAAALDGVNKQILFIVRHCGFCNLMCERSSLQVYLILLPPFPPSVNCFLFLIRGVGGYPNSHWAENGHTIWPGHRSNLSLYSFKMVIKTIIMQTKTECTGLEATLAQFGLSTDCTFENRWVCSDKTSTI